MLLIRNISYLTTAYPQFVHFEEMESLELERIQTIKQGIQRHQCYIQKGMLIDLICSIH